MHPRIRTALRDEIVRAGAAANRTRRVADTAFGAHLVYCLPYTNPDRKGAA